MKPIMQILAMLVVIPATYLFVFWVPLSLVSFGGVRWIPMAIALGCALVVAWFVWKLLDRAPDELMSSIGSGAIACGVVGFLGGFFGPLIFSPESNQGPMLGIFITGPLGVLLGAIAGAIYWKVRKPS